MCILQPSFCFTPKFILLFSEIKAVIDSFGSHLNVDLQQRGVEFSQLFRAHSNLRPALLEKMPPMQISRVSNQNGDSPEENGGVELIENGLEDFENVVRPPPISEQNALLDLLGGTDGPIDFKPAPTEQNVNTNAMTNATSNNQDLLDLLGGLDLSNPTVNVNSNDNTNNGNNMFSMQAPLSTPISSPQSQLITGGLFDDLSAPISHPTGLRLTALDKNGISVVLVPQRIAGCLQVIMTATNSSLTTLEQFLFQAAVPRSFTLQMMSPSGSTLSPGETITQEMRLTCSARVSVVHQHFVDF